MIVGEVDPCSEDYGKEKRATHKIVLGACGIRTGSCIDSVPSGRRKCGRGR